MKVAAAATPPGFSNRPNAVAELSVSATIAVVQVHIEINWAYDAVGEAPIPPVRDLNCSLSRCKITAQLINYSQTLNDASERIGAYTRIVSHELHDPT